MDNLGLQFYIPRSYNSYSSNPFINYSGSLYSSPFYNSSYNFGYNTFSFIPDLSFYNLLNRPAFNNFGYNQSYTSGYGSYQPLFNTMPSYNSLSNYGGYNYLTSGNTFDRLINLSSLQNPTFNFQTNYTQNPFFTPVQNQNFNEPSSIDRTKDTEIDLSSNDKIHTDGQLIDRKSKGYGSEFLKKVKKISKEIHCNYRDLLGVMYAESGIKTDISSSKSRATGLIQFMPKTAESLGTTVEELKKMTPLQQLDYVEKFLKMTKKMAGFSDNQRLSAGQLYAIVFMPAKAKQEVFTKSGEKAYEWNKGLDLNKDGRITMTELGQRVKDKYVSDKSFLA